MTLIMCWCWIWWVEILCYRVKKPLFQRLQRS